MRNPPDRLLTDRELLLALRGVGPESEAERGYSYGRSVTKVGPGSQTRAAAGGLEAGEREVHLGAAGRFRWRRTAWLMESVPVRKALVQGGRGFGNGYLEPSRFSSSVEMPENQRAVPPIANTGPDRSRKTAVDLNDSSGKACRGFLRHIVSI